MSAQRKYKPFRQRKAFCRKAKTAVGYSYFQGSGKPGMGQDVSALGTKTSAGTTVLDKVKDRLQGMFAFRQGKDRSGG